MRLFAHCIAAGLGMLTALPIAAHAQVTPQKNVYIIAGTVTSAIGSCPYAASTAIAGYTYFPGFTNNCRFVCNGSNCSCQPVQVLANSWNIAISPPSGAKVGYKLHNPDSFTPTASSITGAVDYLPISSLEIAKGTYTLEPQYNTDSAFSAQLSVKAAGCTIGYQLNFTKGLPTKFKKLL